MRIKTILTLLALSVATLPLAACMPSGHHGAVHQTPGPDVNPYGDTMRDDGGASAVHR